MFSPPRIQTTMHLRIGTAGWSIPRAASTSFPTEGTHLERYARIFSCAEINSTFYRPSRPTTYAKWAASTPADFLFALKAPRTITHETALAPDPTLLKAFLTQTSVLAEKRGPILFQLPPKQSFDPARAEAFLTVLRDLYQGPAVFEPRHETWFTPESESLFHRFEIARAAVDPPKVPAATQPGGTPTLVYYRLHGSPRIYYSSYPPESLATLAQALTPNTWVIFDNTASGAAAEDALTLRRLTT